MSRFIVALAAACLAASLVPVVARAAPAEEVEVVGRSARALGSDEFAAVRGEYLLADGSRLSVEGVRHRPTVALGDQAPVRLLAAGPNQFVSADGRLWLEFNGHANGNVDAVKVTVLSQQARR
ncbi:hypothetical protein [Ideonella sp.]|uniref:hypothetical protein n=1 Tax=Ideonella sp. TaxID=1929293 RepID=UPI002B477943|nr:hypothetical protein [Ideonella sp.]HJV70622.1 hypothetical protein [Ideonella sp.]